MSQNISTTHSLRRVFQQAFVVHDIAESLVSFDETASSEKVRELMEARRYELVGIRTEGRISGYVQLADLGDGLCADYKKEIKESQIILDSASLAELVLRLNEHPRLFVSTLGDVGGIISRTDLQKPPVRMWLFGMVTLIEMRFHRMIEQYCPGETWKPFLSAGRIQKAEELLTERIRRKQDLDLLDCLQMSDKVQIIARNEQLRSLTRYQSRKKLEEEAKMLEKLRNNLAHSQDIIINDWRTIVILSERLDSILEGPPGFREAETGLTDS